MLLLHHHLLLLPLLPSSSSSSSPPPSTTPSQLYAAPGASPKQAEAPPPVAIVKDERTQSEDGTFKFDFEGANGIIVSGSGSATGANGSVVQTGSYKYTAPDGTAVDVTYVADEKGYQPQSDSLPVAPEFPHPIPQFVLDQIAFAAEEDAAAATAAAAQTKTSPSNSYQAPQA
ncbi:cuticle protein AMP1B-like [Macrobrachium rosenbergii]|uniref:cuticle protein AMP1B-like n=1 Tax=Macrobrachium rosenbergii TaxID=79674 RepID=UPI0034D3A57A